MHWHFVMKTLTGVLFALLLGGCAGLLPAARQDVSHSWQSFEEAKQCYDQITPYSTTISTVRSLGFDPNKTSNMLVLNQAQVVNAVLPSPLQERDAIPRGIADCMRMQEACIGYLIEPSKINQNRTGNFFLDFLNFKRVTETTGWKFSALVVVVDDVVVYKQWTGQPKIESTDVRTNPLGPLQSMGETMKVVP
jgi:hypothetical protein